MVLLWAVTMDTPFGDLFSAVFKYRQFQFHKVLTWSVMNVYLSPT